MWSEYHRHAVEPGTMSMAAAQPALLQTKAAASHSGQAPKTNCLPCPAQAASDARQMVETNTVGDLKVSLCLRMHLWLVSMAGLIGLN